MLISSKSIYRSNTHSPLQAVRCMKLDIGVSRHGDMLFFSFKTPSSSSNMDDATSLSSTSSHPSSEMNGIYSPSVREDSVDVALDKLDGKIQRGRNDQM